MGTSARHQPTLTTNIAATDSTTTTDSTDATALDPDLFIVRPSINAGIIYGRGGDAAGAGTIFCPPFDIHQSWADLAANHGQDDEYGNLK